MYPSYDEIYQMAEMRREEDRRNAAKERMIPSARARLELVMWQFRVREVLESIEAFSKGLDKKDSSLSDST